MANFLTAEAASAAVAMADTDLSVMALVMEADIVVKLVMLILLAGSFWSWAIIVDKWRLFRSTHFRSDKFEKLFAAGAEPEQIYERLKSKADNPMASVFIAAMRECNSGPIQGVAKPSVELKEHAFRRVNQVMQAVKQKSIDTLEARLIFLATVASSAPFIGLFGTVWGIMNSFQSIAQSQNTTLAVVAPGIAEALLATGIGLFAAIPALIFYNMYSNEVRRYTNRLEDFAAYVSTLVAYQIEQKG